LRAFAQSGYEGTHLRRIAADPGVDGALIAHHVGSQLDLSKAVVGSLAGPPVPVDEGGLASPEGGDLADRVRHALRLFRAEAADHWKRAIAAALMRSDAHFESGASSDEKTVSTSPHDALIKDTL
jgi:hypothetical protein